MWKGTATTTNKYLMSRCFTDHQMLAAAVIELIPYWVIYERLRQGMLQCEDLCCDCWVLWDEWRDLWAESINPRGLFCITNEFYQATKRKVKNWQSWLVGSGFRRPVHFPVVTSFLIFLYSRQVLQCKGMLELQLLPWATFIPSLAVGRQVNKAFIFAE